MANPATDSIQKIEQKVTNVLTAGDSKNTQAEVDNIMDEALPAFLEKRGVNLQTGERTTPVAEVKERKETTPPTPEQKKELEKSLEADGQPAVKPEKKEEKAEVKEEKKTEKKEVKAEPKFDDLSDEGINREVESLKTGKAETKERYGALLRELKVSREAGELTKKEFEQAKKDLEDTKKTSEEAAKKAVIPEDVLKQQQIEREELAMLRRQYQLDRDPEVKKNFDDRVDAVEQAIIKTFTEGGIVPPKAIELIQKTGGWIAFSKSKVPMAWTDTEVDKETGEQKEIIRRGTQAEYARYILDRIDPADSAAINARSGEQSLLRDGKQRFVEEEKKKASEYFKNMEAQFKTRQEADVAARQKLETDYAAWATKVSSEEDFLKDEAVPDKATAEEKKAITEANADRATIRAYVAAQSKTVSLEAYQDLVMNAARGLVADKIAEAAEAEIKALESKVAEQEAELAKVRGGNRTVTKGGSLTGSGAPTTDKPAKKEASVDSILADLDKFAEDKGNG